MLHVENHDCAVKCRLVLAHEISPLAHAILLAPTYPGYHAGDHRQLREHRPGRLGIPARPWADYLLWMMVTRQTIIVPDGQIGGYASSHDCRVNCSLRSADRRGRSRAPGEYSGWARD